MHSRMVWSLLLLCAGVPVLSLVLEGRCWLLVWGLGCCTCDMVRD
jgi:hypothetical protein